MRLPDPGRVHRQHLLVTAERSNREDWRGQPFPTTAEVRQTFKDLSNDATGMIAKIAS